jgi:hypothetical protein
MNDSYCMKCKTHSPVTEIQLGKTKTNVNVVDGKCGRCGSRMYMMINKADATAIAKEQGHTL